MADRNSGPAAPSPPTPAEVLSKLAQRKDLFDGPFDRIEIRSATETQFAYRVYPYGARDYEGGVITFPADA